MFALGVKDEYAGDVVYVYLRDDGAVDVDQSLSVFLTMLTPLFTPPEMHHVNVSKLDPLFPSRRINADLRNVRAIVRSVSHNAKPLLDCAYRGRN